MALSYTCTRPPGYQQKNMVLPNAEWQFGSRSFLCRVTLATAPGDSCLSHRLPRRRNYFSTPPFYNPYLLHPLAHSSAWCKQCLPGLRKPDVLHPDVVGVRGSMVTGIWPCLTMSALPRPPRKVDKYDMEEFDTLDSSEERSLSYEVDGGPQAAKQEGGKTSKKFLCKI